MDNRNVFVAIALSMSVLLFWGAFFETPRQDQNIKISNELKNENNQNQNDITPNINQNFVEEKISREDSIAQTDRIVIENDKVIGSISLRGAVFDDLSLL